MTAIQVDRAGATKALTDLAEASGEFASPLVEGAASDIEVSATTVRLFRWG
jgi:hypothetical protein